MHIHKQVKKKKLCLSVFACNKKGQQKKNSPASQCCSPLSLSLSLSLSFPSLCKTKQNKTKIFEKIVLTYLCLRVSFDSNGMAENLKGYATVPIFTNPLFKSKTPTEFWTKVRV